MTTLEIITGTSFFTGIKVVGVALKGASDCAATVRWAETIKNTGGRPAAVENLNNFAGRKTEAEIIELLCQQWQTWAAKGGIQLTINKKPRLVGRF
jgi:hypothetical protein